MIQDEGAGFVVITLTHASNIRLPSISDALIIPVIAGSCLSSGITVSRVQ